MTQPSNQVTDTLREHTALTVMRLMLNDYAQQSGVSFDEAMQAFTMSPAYEALFDYDTGLWKEGPDYLCQFWMKCQEETT